MGCIVQAFIEHRLTPEEVLQFPEQLKAAPDATLAGQWCWTTPAMSEERIAALWCRKADYFLTNSWSVEDLALLEKEAMTLHFFTSNLVTFDSSLPLGSYNGNESLRKEFDRLTKSVLSLIGLAAVDVLIVPELGSVGLFDEHEDLTVGAYRRKANGNKSYAMEIG